MVLKSRKDWRPINTHHNNSLIVSFNHRVNFLLESTKYCSVHTGKGSLAFIYMLTFQILDGFKTVFDKVAQDRIIVRIGSKPLIFYILSIIHVLYRTVVIQQVESLQLHGLLIESLEQMQNLSITKMFTFLTCHLCLVKGTVYFTKEKVRCCVESLAHSWQVKRLQMKLQAALF